MERRSFLGGVLLTAVSPLALGSVGEAAASPEEVVKASLAKKYTPIRNKLSARIHAHYALTNEAPKVLFVNASEYEDLLRDLAPEVRYTNVETAAGGYDNLMFKGVPIIYADQTLPFNPKETT